MSAELSTGPAPSVLAFLDGDEVNTGAGLVVSTRLSVGRQGAGDRSLLGPYLEGREI